MDRPFAYVGQSILEWMFTRPAQDNMLALGKALQAVAGTNAFVVGLPCTSNTPAALNVLVGEGEIYQSQNVEASTMGTLPADTSHQVLKQGMLRNTQTVACAAPGTAGQSINYLVQCTYQDQDVSIDPTTGATNVVLQFFSGVVGGTPYSGPGNTGATSNTFRKGVCVVSAKAGAAAATGTQTTPSPDAGYVGLYVVTVANGQTTITSGNIVQLGTAPYLNTLQTLQTTSRIRLQANTTFYVSTTGSDSNNGLTLGGPWLTRQHAWNTILNNYDLNGFSVQVQLANGSYTDALVAEGALVGAAPASAGFGGVNGALPNAPLKFIGNTGTPGNVTITVSSGNPFFVGAGANIAVEGMKLGTSGGSAAGICATNGGLIGYSAVDFGACSGAHVLAEYGGVAYEYGAYSITGGATAHIQAGQAGQIVEGGFTVTLTGTPAFSGGFAQTFGGFIQAVGVTYSGSATGPRYNATLNGVINTGGGGASYFPGGTAGSTATGGQYA